MRKYRDTWRRWQIGKEKGVDEGRDLVIMEMRSQRESCFHGIDKENQNTIRFIQFSVGRHKLSRLGGIVNENDLQFSSGDSLRADSAILLRPGFPWHIPFLNLPIGPE